MEYNGAVGAKVRSGGLFCTWDALTKGEEPWKRNRL